MNRGLFTENERSAWIFLNRFPDLGPVRFRRLLLLAKSAQGILELPAEDLQAAEVPYTQAERWYRMFRDPLPQEWLEREFCLLKQAHCEVVTELDEGYPEALRELFDRPSVLYYKGSWPSPEKALVGLVGTRHPSGYGKSVAERLAADLCGQGIGTVSGLAQGIDTYVHQATLRAGGYTAAVLGCGLGQVFPKENAILQKQIAERGIVISEFPYETAPAATQFPRRNRIISGLSQGVVVIEAAKRSGASITARFAAEQGREVFAVPGSIFQPTSAGCHRLIKQGAKLVENAEDILEELKIVRPQDPAAARVSVETIAVELPGLEGEILRRLAHTDLSADQISKDTSRRFEEVASSLLSLELKGMIRMLPGQRYAKN